MNDLENTSGAKYPAITKACLEISYDNGGVNRDRSEKKVLREMAAFLDRWPQGPEHLAPIEAWLAQRADAEIETICCGEHTEMQALLKDAPPFTGQLLADYFEQVC